MTEIERTTEVAAEAADIRSAAITINPKRDNTVVVLEGPPRAGKSCLRQMLKDLIKGMPEAREAEIYPFVITACPDGEGSWFQETTGRDADLARKLKDGYKSKFTPAFVARVSADVENCSLPLTFVDIGGIPSPENRQICASATHAVLIVPKEPKDGRSPEEHAAEWLAFNRELGIKTIAVLISDYHGTSDSVEGVDPDGILRGSIHHLERGENLLTRTTGQALARHTLNIALARQQKEPALPPLSNDLLLARVQRAVDDWQKKLGPEIKVVLGGSLVSDTFVPEGAQVIDADVRFLTRLPLDESLIRRIETATGLKYRKTITVADWPDGTSSGVMIEGMLQIDGIPLPVEVEGCLRNQNYVGWHQYYRAVFTEEERAAFRAEKLRLRGDKPAYKRFKALMREDCQRRAVERGLVRPDRAPFEE